MLAISCEQLVEGENRDRLRGSLQYPIHLELDVLCQDVAFTAIFNVADVQRELSTLLATYLPTVMFAKPAMALRIYYYQC